MLPGQLGRNRRPRPAFQSFKEALTI